MWGAARRGCAGSLCAAAAALLWTAPAPGAAQSAPTVDPATGISSACAADAFRQFDYWLGSWIVRGNDGRQIGESRITRLSHGCVIQESWKPPRGPEGTSLNFFEPSTGRWNQLWVGGGGQILRLEGGLEDGVMTLGTRRPGPDGKTLVDRIRWIPHEDGRVEQLWETREDGTDVWRTTFVGFYERSTGGR